ncbi:DUF6059 family protein [Streptomyces indicus]|uniref:Uncharacterized protein n=1 Tax=Streptomyces indicus TaxID=417292 RepID=A0A1G9J3Y4_9ACTN|nr:DUF6059 family protein [Streptomyces indicus]SDL31966.1 hypothetical protein SAMN05421806_12724 [Streptomyces indicus]
MVRPLVLVARLLNEAYRCLVAYGQMWLYLPEGHPRSTVSHPLERLRPDIPLSPAERALDRQLRDLDRLG